MMLKLRLAGCIALALGIAQSNLLAEGNQIVPRPLTPQEINDLGLPAGTQRSGGLNNIGVGEPFYLEAQVPQGTEVSAVAWSLTAQPEGSTATLTESPLGPEVPIYNIGDRTVSSVVGRKLLVPDHVGTYTVSATLTTPEGEQTMTRDLVAATYVGVGEGRVFTDPLKCSVCHTDKFAGWQGTHHASAFREQIDGEGSSHFNEGCIQCHALGHDTTPAADNGGFDDIARLVAWAFPENLEAGNWDAMHPDLQNVSNVQCESCHGAGSAHVAAGGNPALITMSTSSGDCAQCHDAEPYHLINQQWNSSRHAIATRYPTGEGRESCVGCHSGVGFIDRADGIPQAERRTDWEAIVCATCHDPHVAENPHQLRKVDGVTLMNGVQIAMGGNGRICMNCHISRQDAESYASEYHRRFGPHHGPQTDMLAGTNAIDYGQRIPSSAHLFAVKDTCATCHMQSVSSSNPAHTLAGGHTFKPLWDGGTPDDHSDDIALTAACTECHGEIDSFDFRRQDFDGNGIIDGVQTEVKGLLRQVAMSLPPLGVDAVEVAEDYTPAELKAAFNYLFVEEDGSFGVHNLSYTLGILRGALADLQGTGTDQDGDGLLDSWEVQYFGSIEVQNATGDPDEDGLPNATEFVVSGNPVEADSDGDGYGDFAELHAGSNLQNPEDNPVAGRSSVYPAVEYVFFTEEGKNYQVQVAEELGANGWQNSGEPIEGNGDVIQLFSSTREEARQFFRVVESE
jgi:hypothetical protein